MIFTSLEGLIEIARSFCDSLRVINGKISFFNLSLFLFLIALEKLEDICVEKKKEIDDGMAVTRQWHGSEPVISLVFERIFLKEKWGGWTWVRY